MKQSLDEPSPIQKSTFKNIVQETDIWLQHIVSKLDDDFQQIIKKSNSRADSVLSQVNQNGQQKLLQLPISNRIRDSKKIKSYRDVFEPPSHENTNRSILKDKPNNIVNLITKNIIVEKLRLSDCWAKYSQLPNKNLAEEQAVSFLNLRQKQDDVHEE